MKTDTPTVTIHRVDRGFIVRVGGYASFLHCAGTDEETLAFSTLSELVGFLNGHFQVEQEGKS